MIQTIKHALSVKEIRTRLFFILFCTIIMRIGANIPAPGVNADFIKTYFQNTSGAMNIFDMFTGGSFSNVSILALSITPYITASIVMQLMTFAVPKLEELQKDGETGRKKISKATRYLAIVLSIVESVAMIIGFGKQGLLIEANAVNSIAAATSLVAGSAFLIWLGDQITEKGVGNGTSIILLVNIVSRMPSDIIALFEQFVKGKKLFQASASGIIIVAVILLTIMLVVILEGGHRDIPVQYSAKVQGRRLVGGQGSSIPVKVNTAGVIPVIFASSILSIPPMIASFIGKTPTEGVPAFLLNMINQSNWFNPERMQFTAGFLLYAAMIVFFAYFYTAFTFNPAEIADNIRKSGGLIPGIRAGKQTENYIKDILRAMIFFGSIGLILVAAVPIICSGLFSANVSFGGTSLIIIVGVILETSKQIESMLAVKNYKGFLAK